MLSTGYVLQSGDPDGKQVAFHGHRLEHTTFPRASSIGTSTNVLHSMPADLFTYDRKSVHRLCVSSFRSKPQG